MKLPTGSPNIPKNLMSVSQYVLHLSQHDRALVVLRQGNGTEDKKRPSSISNSTSDPNNKGSTKQIAAINFDAFLPFCIFIYLLYNPLECTQFSLFDRGFMS